MKLKILQAKIDELVKKASFRLRPDLQKLLIRAHVRETQPRAKKALAWIIENYQIAAKENLAICQDTGYPVIFVEVGKGKAVSTSSIDFLKKAISISYKKNFLRPSLIDPLKRGASGYNCVSCNVEFNPRLNGIKITLLPKGFGSENKSKVKMFNPMTSLYDIEKFVIGAVKEAGPESCPPFIVGVGIGGTSDKALLLAKKSLLLPLDKPNFDKDLFRLEKNIFKKINNLKIGAMGFRGVNSVLAVRIKKESTHIAGLPVGVNISCHALRSASILIDKL